MAVITEAQLSDCVNENRFSAEFFDPRYVFQPNSRLEWAKIGRILSNYQYGISISMNEEGKGYPIVRMNEINDCFVGKPAKFANISEKEFSLFRLNKGDVLFNRTNSFEFVGRTGLVPEDTTDVFASYLIRINPDAEKVLPEYLAIYLNTQFGIGQVKRRAMRSINQANVSASELRQILIPLAPMKLQTQVADQVRSAYSEIQMGKELYHQAQSLLESELGLDKLSFDKPVSYAARFSEVALSQAILANRIDAQCFSPTALQYEQALVKLANVQPLRFLTAAMVKGTQQEESPDGTIPYVSIKHIQNNEIVAEGNSRRFKGMPVAKQGDLLLAITGATIGKVGIVSRYEELTFSGDLLAITTNGSINPHYLLAFLSHRIGQVQLQRWITGSTNGHLSPHDVGRVLIPRLDEKLEQRIASLMKESIDKTHESERLLDQAKHRVEALIEEAIAA